MDVNLTLADVRRLVRMAFPARRVDGFESLSGGLCNINLKILFESNEAPVVLRLYRHDPVAVQKEVELLSLVRKTVPVPEVLHANYEGIDHSGPFAFIEFVAGPTFQQLRRTNDVPAIRQASYKVGQTLAAIGSFGFTKPGRLGPGLCVGEPYLEADEDRVPRLFDSWLTSANLQRRIGDLHAELHDLVWSWSKQLRLLANPTKLNSRLVHSDFGPRNIIVREVSGKWEVAAIIDWEFAFSGSPLVDVGHFLRYERAACPLREPEFSRAFIEHGGTLPNDWRKLVKLIDLTALCEMLTRDSLPEDVASEVVGLVRSTLEEFRYNPAR
jgi:aminoglycoside phosphotransferase (APT) family kinase protein